MAKQEKWQRRERKQQSKRSKQPQHGRSLFTIIEQQIKRAEQAKKEAANGTGA